MHRSFALGTHLLCNCFSCCLAILVTSACGGSVDSGQGSAPGNSGTGGYSNGSSGGDQKLLPDCGPGFPVSQASDTNPCNFFVGTTCYATQDDACGCVCPRDQGPVICVANGNAYLNGTDAYGIDCFAQ